MIIVADKEFILNYTVNRWKLNRKGKVGKLSENIRRCTPSNIDDWKNYYYENVHSEKELKAVGKELYHHIKKDLPLEYRFHPRLIRSILQKDCIDYIHDLIFERTFSGFAKEHGLQ